MLHPTCRTCGITIRWQPTVVGGKTYCCLGCAHGGPCECDYDNLPHEDKANALVRRPNHDLQRPGEPDFGSGDGA